MRALCRPPVESSAQLWRRISAVARNDLRSRVRSPDLQCLSAVSPRLLALRDNGRNWAGSTRGLSGGAATGRDRPGHAAMGALPVLRAPRRTPPCSTASTTARADSPGPGATRTGPLDPAIPRHRRPAPPAGSLPRADRGHVPGRTRPGRSQPASRCRNARPATPAAPLAQPARLVAIRGTVCA